MIVSDKNIKFDLTNVGSITDLHINDDPYGLSVPIYPVVFKSHAFKKPVNDHLNDSAKININNTSPVEFTKAFEDINVYFELSIKDDTIKFEVKTDKSALGVNLGLVIPVQSDEIFSGNDPLFRPMCLFKPAYKYPDQQEISIPAVRFKWGSKDVEISAEASASISFFIHKQNNQNCVRISSETNHLSILLSFNHTHQEIVETQEIEKIFHKIESRMFEIEKEKNVDITYVFDLCRSLRHAGFCWEVDYIKPNENMARAIDLINQVESTVYASQNSVMLKNKFQAEINQAAAFQTVRAHIRAEDGKIADAITVLGQFFKHSYDMLNTMRKGTIIFSLSIAYLCDAQFLASYRLYEELWNLVRYTENNRRYSEGTMDAWIMLNLVYSFFMHYVLDFKNFFSTQVKSPASEIYRHKQKYFMQAMENDISPIVAQIGIGFYRHATTKFSTLPKFEI